ncbi:ABC transporter permease [Rhodoplanes sp. TEM]|uniref:ABC transporter permease n=1 Tax=Rhodoplanes tepidamans TaxID=200616 RepID=A0ABT5JHI4_RHOTP|nr:MULTISPECIES: ABC transporter permease [Rhodoplanes]MDC7789056.1 ABC transporter permease [Rhodoplanes tepidamans]MDC7982489.1 ABC transporter permease [Rhodoplanes sp. TEM]MDQ0354939.1 ABC-2 type transport system permease protein [Rhodoplanes tepidamans]
MGRETRAVSKRPAGTGLAARLANVFRLTVKELRSIRADPIMLLLVVYAFTINVYSVATGASVEATNLAVAVVDEDRSALSRRIADGLTPPLFRPAVEIGAAEIDGALDAGRVVFVVEIPPRFEADVLAGRKTAVQVNVDATAITQAGNGSAYIRTIVADQVASFLAGRDGAAASPVDVVVRATFNPNLKSSWFTSVMQVVNSITMLTVILTGAALIREREQGTVEHLLIMPVVPSEIMLSKILANGLVTLVATGLSLVLVVQGGLAVPIAGSLPLFLAGAAVYVFTVAALGIMLGTIANTMGQFGLLAIPVLLVTQLLSGSATPLESMPAGLRWVMWTISPTPHFVSFAQGVLYRGAGATVVWPPLVAVAVIGGVYFAVALRRFRRVVFGA